LAMCRPYNIKWEYDWKYLDHKNTEETIYDFFEITVELRDL